MLCLLVITHHHYGTYRLHIVGSTAPWWLVIGLLTECQWLNGSPGWDQAGADISRLGEAAALDGGCLEDGMMGGGNYWAISLQNFLCSGCRVSVMDADGLGLQQSQCWQMPYHDLSECHEGVCLMGVVKKKDALLLFALVGCFLTCLSSVWLMSN